MEKSSQMIFTCENLACKHHDATFGFTSKEERDKHIKTCSFAVPGPSVAPELLNLEISEDGKKAITKLMGYYGEYIKPISEEEEKNL